MKSLIKNLTIAGLAITALAGSALNTNAQATTVGVDSGAHWIGYMNVFELPSNGGGYAFGSPWGTGDLCANFSGSTLTLSPNTINDPGAYWYTPSGGPGAAGNKTMDASFYVDTTGLYTGQTLTFSGNVLANTLVSPYTSVAFIKDFNANYSSLTTVTAPLVNGAFSLSLAASSDPAHHIQYGFETIGPDVWATDVAGFGSVQIAAVPEPSTLALFGLALGIPALLRRRK